MKVNSTVFAHFLKRCIVNTHGIGNKSVISFPDMLLVVNGNEMIVEGVSNAGSIQIKFVESLSESHNYEEFPIVDSVMLQNFIESQFNNEDLEVYMKDDDIIFESEMTKLNFPTVNIIETMTEYPEAAERIKNTGYNKIKFETCVTILNINLVSAIGKSGSTYKTYIYEFVVKNGELTIRVQTDDKGGVVKKTISTVDGPDISAQYSIGIDTVFKDMGSEIKLYFNQDTPMMAVDNNGNTCIFFPIDI